MIDDTNYEDWELRTKARTFEEQIHPKTWKR
jgi:hypothetical protein